MNKLRIKGELNEQIGRRKQDQACPSGDRLKCIEGKEEALVGKLQKEFSKGEDEILETMEEMDEEEKK